MVGLIYALVNLMDRYLSTKQNKCEFESHQGFYVNVVELVYTIGLSPIAFKHAGSSPVIHTILNKL